MIQPGTCIRCGRGPRATALICDRCRPAASDGEGGVREPKVRRKGAVENPKALDVHPLFREILKVHGLR